MIEADDVFRGRREARAGNPDRRMRLLDRPRPQVHHAELIVPAVPGEDLFRRPRLGHQRQRLAVALALFDRDDGVGDRRVRRQPGGKSGDQPPAADAVEHRVFLGDARRRRGGGQRRAELDDRDVLAVGLPRQDRAHDARIGHEPIDVLVMLIGAQPVQAGLRRMQHLVERGVVVLADLVGIGDVEPDGIDMGRVVAPLEIGRAGRDRASDGTCRPSRQHLVFRQCSGRMLRLQRRPLNQARGFPIPRSRGQRNTIGGVARRPPC